MILAILCSQLNSKGLFLLLAFSDWEPLGVGALSGTFRQGPRRFHAIAPPLPLLRLSCINTSPYQPEPYRGFYRAP